MPFDPSLLEEETSSGFDPSLLVEENKALTPEDESRILKNERYNLPSPEGRISFGPGGMPLVPTEGEYLPPLQALSYPKDVALEQLKTGPEPFETMGANPLTAKRLAGFEAGAVNLAKSVTSPEVLALGTLGGAPQIVQRLAAGGFLADMLRQTPQVYQKLGDAFGRNDPEAESEALFDAVTHAAFTTGTAHGTFRGARPAAIKQAVNDFIRRTPRQQREQLYQGEPDASQNRSSETVHETVREPAGESAAEVSAPDRDQGVQPPAEQGIQAPQEKLPDLQRDDVSGLLDKVGGMSPEEFQAWSARLHEGKGRERTTKQLADAALEGDFVDDLKARYEQINQRWRDEVAKAQKEEDPARKLEHLERAGLISDQGQFFNEAYNFARADPVTQQERMDQKWNRPLSAFSGEMPPNKPHFPVVIENARGHRYEAYMAGYIDYSELGMGVKTQIGKVRPGKSEADMGLSHGFLGKNEKIVAGDYPKTPEEYKAAVESGVKPPRTLATEAGKEIQLTPVIRSGEVMLPGKNHADALEKATASGDTELISKALTGEKGFTDQHGKFYTRQEAAEIYKRQGGDPGRMIKPEEGLHSEDLQHLPQKALTPDQPGPLGITPGISPAIQKFGKLARGTITKLNNTRKAFGTLFRSGANRKLMDQTLDAADNQAVISGQQVRKGLELGTTKRDQNAASFIIESGFDKEKLSSFLAKVAKNPEATLAVHDALREWNRLEKLARRGAGDFDGQLQDEAWNGINTEYHADYVPHLYDQDLWMGAGRPYVVGGGSGISTGFKKGRVFDTLPDAIEAGYKPKSLALAELAEHRVRAGQRLINRKQWANGLRTVTDPTDGRKLVTDLIYKPRGPGQSGFEVAPKGYRVQEIIPGVRIAVHEAYVPLFKALTGESAVAASTPGKLALEGLGAMKHGLLAFDTFHASRIAQKQAVLGIQLPSYKKGASLLEYADRDLHRAVAEGVLSQETADWVRQNRATGELGIKNGLNVGRVQEALYNSFIRDLPGIGTFNKWVFEKLTRGAMLESFIHEFNRVSRIKPTAPQEQVAREVARDLNTYFGNLGRQGFFKSRTMQDMARIIALAPQWVESMARTEAKGYAQAVKGVTYDPLVHKTLMVGSLGKAMGQGLLAYFVATQLLNLATRKKPTWENDEEGHKLDAWIPSADGKGNGFFVSPFAIPAELTHDMLRYERKDGNALKAAAHILSNKSSSAVRAVSSLTTGKAFYGDPKTDDVWGRVKKAAWSLNPTPIPLQPVERKSYPGQLQRQVTASLGVKTEPAESPVQQMFEKARRFTEAEGKKPVTIEMTDDPSYSKLRSAIRNDNDKESQKLLEDLLKTHNPKQVMQAMKHNVLHPFTGSKAQEMRFRSSLTDKEAQLYESAVNDKGREYEKFLDLWFR